MSPLSTFILAVTTSSTIYSDYPGFVDTRAVVEAYTDRGLIVELIVKCPEGSGILSYSKVDRRFCSSKMDCFDSLKPAIRDTCR